MIEDIKNRIDEREKIVLVGIYGAPNLPKSVAQEHLDELEMLSNTAGGDCVGKLMQPLERPNRATYIGTGKLKELQSLIEQKEADSVIFDDDLTPSQVRNLEKELDTKIIDRSGLILDIFASRARSAASKTQVELAQLQYLMPRLTRYWTHLSRQKGGIGTKGPGETQIETDRRLIGKRIATLKEKLGKLDKQRNTQRKKRSALTRVALVGYTNAGKSTLMNTLTNTNVLAENKLFATLDATSRKHIIDGRDVVISDTVGFIRKLPHNLVESFKSTLDEITEADILLHIVDAGSEVKDDYIKVVNETLEELECAEKTTKLVFNKIDTLAPDQVQALKAMYPNAIYVAAEKGIGIGLLEEQVAQLMQSQFRDIVLRLPMSEYKWVAKLHKYATILDQRYDDATLVLTVRINDNIFHGMEKELSTFVSILDDNNGIAQALTDQNYSL